MTEEVKVISETGGAKGAKPIQFYTIPWEALKEIGRVFYMGGRKYGPYNFRKGYAWSLSYDALHRHLGAFWNREEDNEESFKDFESGEKLVFTVKHIACAAWHAIILTFFSLTGRGTDDRPE